MCSSEGMFMAERTLRIKAQSWERAWYTERNVVTRVESERSARATSCRSLEVQVGCLMIVLVSYDRMHIKIDL